MMFIYILMLLVAIFVLLAVSAPKKYDVRRSVLINKGRAETYQYLKLVKNQDYWSPWKNRDPNMKQSHTGTDGTIGFVNSWEGNKDVGAGEQELTGFVENERIDSELRFFKPWKSVSNGYFLLKEIDSNKTEVTWGFSGTNKVPINIMMLFMNMDKMVGKDFDEGLAKLKLILEK